MAATSNTPNLPATDELNNKKIVQNIFDHLEDYLETFEGFIDIFSLKAMVQHVIDPPIEDPETQLRLYLKAFRNASAFKEAFEKLDTSMQKRIEDFIAGAPADKVSDGFHLIQSPATQEHLRVAPPPSTPPPPSPQSPKLSGFRKFNGLRKLRSLRKSSKASHQAVVKTPVVYEDAAKTKVMEVYSTHFLHIELYLRTIGHPGPHRHAVRELGHVSHQHPTIHICPDHRPGTPKPRSLRDRKPQTGAGQRLSPQLESHILGEWRQLHSSFSTKVEDCHFAARLYAAVSDDGCRHD